MKKKLSVFIAMMLLFTSIFCQVPVLAADLKTDIALAEFEIVPEMVFSGTEQEPSVIISFEKRTLQEDKDYTLEYQNNIKVGVASVLVAGIDEFTGTKELNFNIAPMNVAALKYGSVSDMIYTGKGVKPSVPITYGEITLTEGADYLLEYRDNVDV
jgi:hypothetical protein